MEDLKSLVKSFYTDALTVNPRTNPAEVLERILADDFRSINTQDPNKGKAALIGQIQFFWKLVPDLKWEPQDILQDGRQVIVRSIATGAPNGDFMGITANGSKSFRIMTIDIHAIENGRIKTVHHIEEWSAALAQLKG